jgi:hypothetical protein
VASTDVAVDHRASVVQTGLAILEGHLETMSPTAEFAELEVMACRAFSWAGEIHAGWQSACFLAMAGRKRGAADWDRQVVMNGNANVIKRVPKDAQRADDASLCCVLLTSIPRSLSAR